MESETLAVINRWRAAGFEREAVEGILADDVEWVVPSGGGTATLRGIDEVLEWYGSGGGTGEGTPEDLRGADLDVAEERGELEDYGDGRAGSLNRLVYTRKESGEVAAVTTARLVYTVRDGKIVRYELESLGDSAGSAAD